MDVRTPRTSLTQALVALLGIAWLAACAPAVEDGATDDGARSAPAARPAAAAARTPATIPAADRLVVALQVGVPGFDPRQRHAGMSSELVGVILEPLVTLERDFSLRPRLATAWEVADEGRRLTLQLRDGVTFHDGRPFTAEDVRFTIETGLASDETGAVRLHLSEVTRVETPDASTVVLHAENPSGGLLVALASVPIIPAGSGSDFDAQPIGTGPFAFVRHDVDASLQVERFDGYWGPAPSLPAVEFRVLPRSADRASALARGNAHVSQSSWDADDEQRLENDRNVNVERLAATAHQYLAINAGRPPFDDPDVRRALNHLIPRERIVAEVYRGRALPGVSMLAPSMPWFDPDTPVFAYDVARARELVAASGADFDRTYTVLTNDNPFRNAMAEALVAAFAHVGMRAQLEVAEFSTFLQRIRDGDFDVHLLGMGGAHNVARLLDQYTQETSIFNRGGFSDPEAAAMLSAAAALDPSSPEAVALYRAVANRVVAFSAHAFIIYDVAVGAARSEVEGWWPHPVPALAYQDLHLVRLRR